MVVGHPYEVVSRITSTSVTGEEKMGRVGLTATQKYRGELLK